MSNSTIRTEEPSSPMRPEKIPPRIVVKLNDSSYPYVDGVESRFTGEAAAAWQKLLRNFPGITLLRLFTAVEPRRLDELVERARKIDPDYKPADFKTYYVLTVSEGKSAIELIRGVLELTGVRSAYVESPPIRPSSITVDPLSGTQRYLEAAPVGIGAKNVWNVVPGAGGDGIMIADVEQGWTLDHEDLPVDPITGLSLVRMLRTSTRYDHRGHGTAVLGILLAVDNDTGCVGIVPNCSAGAVPIYESQTVWSIPNALLVAVDGLAYGDVLLIEQQVIWGGFAVAVEAEDASFDMIRLATALGIVVVEAAGNGGQDLDTVHQMAGGVDRYPFARNPVKPGYRDSGAIVVAYAYWNAAGTYSPTGSSTNFGSRIDCFAEGHDVGTLGDMVPAGSAPDEYLPAAKPGEFSGTSAASAIVAGAAVSVQGMVQAQAGARLSGLQVRSLLSDVTPGINTASLNGPAVDRIGVMPNLEQINLTLPDLVIRDFPGDLGDPHTGPLSMSPDIIVRGGAVADPTVAFGEGSGTEGDVNLSDSVQPGQDHYVYVRVRNRGGKDAANTKAKVYWSEVSTLVTPDQWHLIGEVAMGNVPADDKLYVSQAILWPAGQIPAAGHYCFVALVGDDWDPMPSASNFPDWDHYLRFIRDVNNVSWRNFNVESLPAGSGALEVLIPFNFVGPRHRVGPMGLEVATIPPSGCGLDLELPAGVQERTRIIRFRSFSAKSQDGDERLWARGHLKIVPFVMNEGQVTPCRLRVRLAEEVRKRRVEVIVRQTFEGREVGRITWRLEPQAR